jgi:hypothetical protein
MAVNYSEVLKNHGGGFPLTWVLFQPKCLRYLNVSGKESKKYSGLFSALTSSPQHTKLMIPAFRRGLGYANLGFGEPTISVF